MAFRVHQPKEFTEIIMPRYFHQTQYKSFQRQLHIYGFRRISAGLDQGSYYHPMFVRGKVIASLRMTRCKIKGLLANVAVEDPNFYHPAETVGSGVMNMVLPDQERSAHQAGSSSTFSLSTEPSRMVCSSRSCADPVLSKAESWPTLRFAQTKPCHERPDAQPKLHHIASCGGVTHQAHMMMLRDEIPSHNMMFGGSDGQTMTTMMLPDDFQPLPWNRIPHDQRRRRSLLLEEGDEAFFAGKKFFYVEKPSLLPTLPTCSEGGRRRAVWASGA
jgi:HSF-type DNA-binding